MKGIRRIAIWAILSIMMQMAGLIYLDKVVFKYSSKFTVVKNDNGEKDKAKNRTIKFSIPADAEKIKVSDDSKYITYIQNNKLILLDTSTLQTKEIITNKGIGILNYKWVLDEDIILVAEKVNTSSYNASVRFITYNVKNDYETTMAKPNEENLCTYKNGMVVDDIVSSSGTGTNYIGVSRNGYNSSIYRIDINFKKTTVGYNISQLGGMKAVQDSDILVYEDSLNKRFYYYTNGSSTKINFTDSSNMVLIGVDDNKNVYMGALENEKITKIMYGQYNSNPSTWQTITLEKPKDLSDIIITEDDQLLVNDNLSGKLTNLSTKKSTEYDGKLLQITSKYLCTTDDGKIIFEKINN